jgi:hypothetical protein
MLDVIGARINHSRDKNLVERHLYLFENRPLVLVTRVRGFERYRTNIGGKNRFDNIGAGLITREPIWNRNFRLQQAFVQQEPPQGTSGSDAPHTRAVTERRETDMKHHRTTLLAGIAALALVAGNGLARAQDNSKAKPAKLLMPRSK